MASEVKKYAMEEEGIGDAEGRTEALSSNSSSSSETSSSSPDSSPLASRTSPESESSSSSSKTCCGCGKESNTTLKCPTCLKLDLPPSFFCGQDCFRKNWNEHKLVHRILPSSSSSPSTTPPPSSSTGPQNPLEIKEKIQKLLDPKFYDPSNRAVWPFDSHLRRFQDYQFTGPLRPWPITPMRKVNKSEINQPDYADSSIPHGEIAMSKKSNIHVHTPEETERLRESCLLGRKALDLAHEMIAPGVTTEEIDAKVHQFIVSNGAYPSPLNYYKFPKSCCTSINEVVCHGIPDHRPLQAGDIINVDITVYYKGMHGDLNETFFVKGKNEKGEDVVEPEDVRRLRQGAYTSLMTAIAQCKIGKLYREIGGIITAEADKHKLSVVKTYCGHGIGALFHTSPNVPHYKKNKAIGMMKEGHAFTIEPMLNLGSADNETWPDDWTAVTIDGKKSAQFEHTLLMTKDGVEILTARLPSSPPLDLDEVNVTHNSSTEKCSHRRVT